MFRDGWLHTKDIVRRTADGSFYMCGRISQFINVGGNKVSPAEVENALLTHPSVSEAAVISRRNETTSEEIVAFVVPRDAAAPPVPRELLAHCKTCLSPYKQPRTIHVLDTLPKSPLGKVLKTQLFDVARTGIVE
jgi:acyl-coenzyme A synthetase/AMP-(fatty) acid ligase